MTQYYELQNITTYRALTAALLEMKKATEDGAYEERWKKYAKTQDRELFDWQIKIMHNKKTETGTNNKRFSHRFPMGIDVDDPQTDPSLQAFLDAKKAERARAAREAAKATGSPLLANLDELKLPRKWYVLVFVNPYRWLKNDVGWPYIIFCLILCVPLIGGFMWGNMGSNPKFTQDQS